MKNWDKIIHETYEMLFKASEPSIDFNELLENAYIDEYGDKHIPFLDYEIDKHIEDEIIERQIKKYKLDKIEKRRFYFAIYLGCSPKTKK